MLAISSAIRKTETQDGAVLLDVERGQMYCLNLVGSKILELIASGCDEREIIDRLSAVYGAKNGGVRADVREFIETMRKHGIVDRRVSNTRTRT